jgi:exonuclease SbcC
MVIFRELEMEGFKKYDHPKIYKFNEGLIGVFGKNESGKSTIGDAISVSLFGLRPNTPYKKNEIVTWGKDKSNLSLEFETDVLYRVERSLGNKSRASLQKQDNGKWVTLANTIKTVDNQVQDILGLDYKSFKNSIFIAQNDLNSLSSLSKQERQNIINRLSRYDELSRAETILKENIKELNTELNILNHDYEHLEGIVSDKIGKYDKLQELIENYTNKNQLLTDKKTILNEIRFRLKIFIELKKINDTLSKINDQKRLIDEKLQDISRIEEKESEKQYISGELDKLNYVNSDLKADIEELRDTVFQIRETNNRRKDVKEYQSLITEKNREITRIEEKESEKQYLLGELGKLEHITSDLENRIKNIGLINGQLRNLREVESDRVRENIEVLTKKIDDTESLINDKNIEITRIEEKESEKTHLNNELVKLEHLTPDLKFRIEEFNTLNSEAKSVKKDLERLDKEKIEKISLLENEEELKSNHDTYKTVSGLQANSDSLRYDIDLLDENIDEKKSELGDLKEETGNLSEIERKYENGKSRSNTLIGAGVVLLILGFVLGFTINIFLIVISLIGLAPIYKGYNDRNFFKNKLRIIKGKREVFGQLNQLEIQYNDKINVYKTNEQELEKYKNYDIESLKNDSESYESLNKEKNKLKELEDQENNTKNKLEIIHEKLKNEYQNFPSHYKDLVKLDDTRIDKEISKIYQEEDKKRSNYNATIQELNKEINRKPVIQSEKEKLEQQKKELQKQYQEKLDLKNQITKRIETLYLNLKEEYDKLPSHYQDSVSFDDPSMDKEVLRLYQNEDKLKSNYNTTLKSLDKEIERKPLIQNELNNLEKEKTELEAQISTENQRLNKNLKNKYDELPSHYQDSVSFEDPNMDKEVLRLYLSEDKLKSNYNTTLKSLDKEIERKPLIQQELNNLEHEKQELLNQYSQEKTALQKLTKEEIEYNPMEHQILEEKEKNLNQEINQCMRIIGDIEGEIRTLKNDTKDLNEKQDKLNVLNEKIIKLNYKIDVTEIAKNEISNTAKMLREQVMERTRKYVHLILPKITNHKYQDVKITEDFKIKVYSPEKNDFESITALSGGARDQVLFSLRLAFTNAILGGRSRSKGFSLFLDEFLGSFDQNRRDETLKMLKELKEDFRQIFLISHIEGMEGNVDQIIRTPE